MLRSAGLDEILALLVSTYQRGRLVPFLGAGMSTPRLTLWPEFVRKLEKRAGIEGRSARVSLEARAQRACTVIQNRDGRDAFLESVRGALEKSPAALPQTENLAKIPWPLVISSNYDDLFFYACRCQAPSAERWRTETAVRVLGRSAKDCKLVVSSLTGPFDRQYIWHVQGFLGGQFGHDARQDVSQLAELREQLVIGHAEYRKVSNRSPEFRRCFAEVFNSRSFLFLGTSLQEDYFLNLFGEVLDLCGPSAVPHFAFAEEGQVDARFLADEMNITVCEFPKGAWDHLPLWLSRLKRQIDRPKTRCTRWCYTIGRSVEARPDLEVVCGRTHLRPLAREVVAFVARRNLGIPVPSDPFTGLKKPNRKISRHVFEYPGPVYAVTARCHETDDNSAVHRACTEFLNFVARRRPDATTVHLQLAASGGSVPPLYAFMEVVRAFGRWRKLHSAVRLVLYIQDDVELSLTAERIDVRELLTSDLIRFWAVVNSGESTEPVRRALHHRANSPLKDVLADLGVPADWSGWSLTVCPSPRKESLNRDIVFAPGMTLTTAGIVFGSVLILERHNGNTAGPRSQPPAMAPTIRKGSAPATTRSGSGVSGGS